MDSPSPSPAEIGSAIDHRSLEEYVDFLSIVILCAPDRFRNYDAPPEWQLDLESSFRLTREGMKFVGQEVYDPELLARFHLMIERAYQAFARYDFEGRKEGCQTMMKFREEMVTAVQENRRGRKKKPH